MAALDPIAGVSLEQYADLCARMRDCGGDLERCAQVALTNGVDRPSWEAAMAGWNARMGDPSTAGQVALAYMPLHQAALARHGEVASATFDEYVRMSAMLRSTRHGLERMMRHFHIDAIAWSQISTHWVGEIIRDAQIAIRFNDACMEEIARLDAGGAPA